MAKMSKEDQETIIVFNEADSKATVFTYNKRWQKHLEENLGLAPVALNARGGLEYIIDKDRIKLPQKKRGKKTDGS